MKILLYPGDDKNVKRLFYATMHLLMMGQSGPKHVGVDILKYYWNSNAVCGFVGLHCNNFIIMHEWET